MQISTGIDNYARSMDGNISQKMQNISTSQPLSANGNNMLSQLVAGKVFEGMIIDIDNGQITLGLGNGEQLQARLQLDMPLDVGQSVFFQVKSNDGARIELTPYSATGNLGNPTILKALEAAGIQVNEKNVYMVDTMMQENMSINKGDIANMARTILNNPDIDIQTLVQMTKLKLPVTLENAQQFTNFQQDRLQVISHIQEFAEELPEILSGKNMDEAAAKELNSQVIALLTDGDKQSTAQGSDISTEQPQNAQEPATQGNATISGSDISTEQPQNAQQSTVQENSIPAEQSQNAQQSIAQGNMITQENNIPTEQSQNPQQSTVQESNIPTEQSQNAQQSTAQGNTTISSGNNIPAEQIQAPAYATTTDTDLNIPRLNTQVATIFNSQELQEFTKLLESSGIVDKDINDMTSQELLKELGKIITSAESGREDIRALLKSHPYSKLLKQVINEQLMLEPQEIASKDKIKDFYDNLEQQMQKFEEIMKAAGHNTDNLRNTSTNIQNNLEFMDQMNQVMQYVQIPMRLAGGKGSGELYVYTNKKNRKAEGEALSAFLHLDMEALGSTDIDVKMLGKKVDTNFSMEREDAFELVRQHIDQLQQILEKLGYNCTINVRKMNKTDEAPKQKRLEAIMAPDMPKGQGIMHRYSFDIKA